MLVFATSDKGGTGRSVTTCNVAYRSALQGRDACYLDFDFGSPTAGAIFGIREAPRGIAANGLHSYFSRECPEPTAIDVWATTGRAAIKGRPDGAGTLTLFPGDKGGSEFAPGPDPAERAALVDLCVQLFLRLEEEYDLIFVDLSAGRSHALELVLAATNTNALRGITCRWLVYHRWTQQHIIAAEGLVAGENGILAAGVEAGHESEALRSAIRYVRTAVVSPSSTELQGLRAEQVQWLQRIDQRMVTLANGLGVGNSSSLGRVPLDPVLQWREQIITDLDTMRSLIANQATVDAFEVLAKSLTEDAAWEAL